MKDLVRWYQYWPIDSSYYEYYNKITDLDTTSVMLDPDHEHPIHFLKYDGKLALIFKDNIGKYCSLVFDTEGNCGGAFVDSIEIAKILAEESLDLRVRIISALVELETNSEQI